MTRKKRLLFIVLTVLFTVVVATYMEMAMPREPMVKRKSLSFWLDQYEVNMIGSGEAQVAKKGEAEEAIRQLSTNAIPELLVLLRKEDHGLETRLFALLEKQRFIRISHKPAWARNAEAADGFQILGATAKGAVPNLVDIFEHPSSPSSQHSSAAALSGIGPAATAAIPSLLRATTNSDASVRLSAVSTLGSIHSEPATVVPALIKCLSDPVSNIRSMAAQSLGRFGPEAQQAIPELTQLLKANERIIRSEAALALKEIEPEKGIDTSRGNK